MIISVMSYSFTQMLRTAAMDTAATIRFAHELGVDAVEIDDGFADDAALPDMQNALDEPGSTGACYGVSGAFITSDRAARQAAVDTVCVGLRRAAALRTTRSLVTPGRLKSGTWNIRAWMTQATRARRACP